MRIWQFCGLVAVGHQFASGGRPPFPFSRLSLGVNLPNSAPSPGVISPPAASASGSDAKPPAGGLDRRLALAAAAEAEAFRGSAAATLGEVREFPRFVSRQRGEALLASRLPGNPLRL
jgi:hypothetical protein